MEEDKFIPEGVWTTTANIHPSSITQIILSNPASAGATHDSDTSQIITETLKSVRDFAFPRDSSAFSSEVEVVFK